MPPATPREVRQLSETGGLEERPPYHTAHPTTARARRLSADGSCCLPVQAGVLDGVAQPGRPGVKGGAQCYYAVR